MYIVLELQTDANGTLSQIHHIKSTLEDALEKYYQTMAYCCKTSLPCHGVMVISGDGEVVKAEFYRHVVEAEPAPENPGNASADPE